MGRTQTHQRHESTPGSATNTSRTRPASAAARHLGAASAGMRSDTNRSPCVPNSATSNTSAPATITRPSPAPAAADRSESHPPDHRGRAAPSGTHPATSANPTTPSPAATTLRATKNARRHQRVRREIGDRHQAHQAPRPPPPASSPPDHPSPHTPPADPHSNHVTPLHVGWASASTGSRADAPENATTATNADTAITNTATTSCGTSTRRPGSTRNGTAHCGAHPRRPAPGSPLRCVTCSVHAHPPLSTAWISATATANDVDRSRSPNTP